MHITSIGIDLGKTTFHLVALGEHNKVLLRKKFSRSQLLVYTANLPSSLIGLEACAGSHFLGAALREQGHQVRLIPAQFVKPYRKSNKNDFLDAEAIAEDCDQAEHALCPAQDAGATRLAGPAPGAGSTGSASHAADRRNPRIPAGARSRFSRNAKEEPHGDRAPHL